MLNRIKLLSLQCLKAFGIFSLLESSKWRKNNLLIIAWHGISLDDEHLWDPELYMTPEMFRSRLDMLVSRKCNVLSLDDAVNRLYSGNLPENSVVLTFDDGFYDFYKEALPILKQYGFPATLYLTTKYTEHNKAIYDVVIPYLLWKARDKQLDMSYITGAQNIVDLSSREARIEVTKQLKSYADANNLSIIERDNIVISISKTLGIDYDQIASKRILQLMTPEEVKNLADQGIDIQLHTHRHRVPKKQDLFYREIEENREAIKNMTGIVTHHFCYPSGVYDDAFIPWLTDLNVSSATTCVPDMASPNSHRLLLPRFIDTSLQAPIAFEGWLTGIASFLPRRQ